MDSDPPPTPPRQASLFAKLAHWQMRGQDGGARVGAAIALLLILGPALTIVGGHITVRSILAETATLTATAEPRLAAQRKAERAREAMRRSLAMPTLGATLDGLARVLPPETTLASVERRADGTLVVEATTADPDRLRGALRRDPATAMLRDAGQRRGDSAMLVTFEGRGR